MSDFSHIPEGYHTITPYLVCKGAAEAIDWYKTVFDASEDMRMEGPDGSVGHAELQVGESKLMLGDECPQMGFLSPASIGGTPVGLGLYVKDADAVYQKAIDRGATIKRPIADQFYGDRAGTVTDPWGHLWTISTRKENLSAEQIRQRAEEMMRRQAGDEPTQ